MASKLTQRQKDKLIEAAQNSIFFAVTGNGDFPFDMLRYDKCWPASEAASRLLDDLLGTQRRVELRGLIGPTVARWRSFGWTVIENAQ
jgi:hypothetical protein